MLANKNTVVGPVVVARGVKLTKVGRKKTGNGH